MNTRSAFLIGIAVLATAIATPGAAEPEILQSQYWQALPTASWVWTDHAGNPWFRVKDGDVAKSYPSPAKTVAENQTFLLGDAAGRIWVIDTDRRSPARYFDGQRWIQTTIVARQGFTDSSRRVFLLDPERIHVFDGSNWSSQILYEKPTFEEANFREDSVGRVWYWATPRKKGTIATRGAWAFDKGKWTHHHADTGFPTDDLLALAPLKGDRLLVVPYAEPAARKTVVWSPGQRLPDQERIPFAPFAADRVSFLGTDPTGSHLFSLIGMKPEAGESWSRIRYAKVSPDGAVTLLPLNWESKILRIPVGLYEQRWRIMTKLEDEPPAVPLAGSEAICRDSAGRIYYRSPPGISVVWPQREKPGEVLRVQPPARAVAQILADETGGLWGIPVRPEGKSALLRWDGKGWSDTPVALTPHPTWTARSMPPWQAWPAGPFVFVSPNGTVLAVVTRDVYQRLPPADKDLTHQEILDAGTIEAKRQKRTRWLEGWLYRDGKWTGPTEIPSLVIEHRAVLAAAFPTGTGRSDYLALAGDGDRLWAAYDGKVDLITPQELQTRNLPLDHPTPGSEHDRLMTLARLSDGRILCSSASRNVGYRFQTLTLADGRIAAADFTAPAWPEQMYHWGAPQFQVGPGQDLWLSLNARGGSLDRVWVRRGSEWLERADLSRPVIRTEKGTWFMPGSERNAGPMLKLPIVAGENTSEFTLPPSFGREGWPALSQGSALQSTGYWVVEIDIKDRKLKKSWILSEYRGGGPVYRDGNGNLILPGGAWAAEK